MPKRIWLLIIALAASNLGAAQVVPPKHESWLHHLFRSHVSSPNNLEQRYRALKCALVMIRIPEGFGTGFFISSDGDIATASHVIARRIFISQPDGKIRTELAMPPLFTVIEEQGRRTDVSAEKVEKNGDAWGADVAVIKSGIEAKCWLTTADAIPLHPGQHLITMGFPGLAWGSLSIYTGIMSANLKLDLVLGTTTAGQPVVPKNEFIRVQMPISTGVSGSPVIDDENRVVGIVTLAGASTRDIDQLIQLNRLNAFAVPPAGPNQVTLNVFSVVAQLAESLRAFASPGYGDAVPIRYLKKAPQDNQQSASPDH